MTTDRRGSFSFELGRPGVWRLWVQARGRATMRSRPLPVLGSTRVPTVEMPALEPLAVELARRQTRCRELGCLGKTKRRQPPGRWRLFLVRGDAQGFGPLNLPVGYHRNIEVAFGGMWPRRASLAAGPEAWNWESASRVLVDARLVDLRGRRGAELWIMTASGTPVARTDQDGFVRVPMADDVGSTLTNFDAGRFTSARSASIPSPGGRSKSPGAPRFRRVEFPAALWTRPQENPWPEPWSGAKRPFAADPR